MKDESEASGFFHKSPSSWSLDKLSPEQLRRLRLYAGLGLLAVGLSGTLAFLIRRQRKGRRFKGYTSYYTRTYPQVEEGLASVGRHQETGLDIDGYEQRYGRGESSRRWGPRDLRDMENSLFDDTPPSSVAYSAYSDDIPSYAYEEGRSATWRTFIGVLIFVLSIFVVAWRHDILEQFQDVTETEDD